MKRDNGFVLILTLLMMVVIAVLVFGTAFTTMIDRRVSANQQGAEKAYYIAQSGLQQYKTLVFRNLASYYKTHTNENWCENPIAGGIKNNSGSFILTSGATSPWTPFADGEYQVTYDTNSNYIILTSVGRVGNSRATVQLVATSGDGPSNPWDNAIFATGQKPGTQAINGNVSVYGSIHIVKGALNLNEDLSLTGAAGVYNNYRGKENTSGTSSLNNSAIDDVMARVTSETYSSVSALPDLCSKIKIERGNLVFENSSARAGTTNVPIYSVHLGEGGIYRKNGQNLTAITDHHNSDMINLRYPAGVGVNSGYEGYSADFPKLPSNYPADLGLTVTPTNCPWLFVNGVIKLPNPATAGTTVACMSGSNSIVWSTTPSPHLEISGTINTGSASVQLTGPIYYKGKGVLRAGTCLDASPVAGEGCASLDPNVGISATGILEPLNGGYPATNALGLVTSGNIFISNKPGTGGATMKESAAVMAYAGGEVTLDKQTLVTGALVSGAFNLGGQVPKVAYHPGILDAAGALCMPGTYLLGSGCDPATPFNGMDEGDPLSEVSYERR